MRKVRLGCLMFVTMVLLLSCHPHDTQNLPKYDRQQVAEIISNHDTTILYFMTSWCHAGQHNFENNLKPYLGNAFDTKAIAVVCIGEVEQVSSLENDNKNVFLFGHPSCQSLADKMFINKECKKLLSHYKRVNYIPVELVCDRNGEILNWNTDETIDRTYGFIYPYLIGWK
ncbi:MAG: hypothetical protein IJ622_10555 [Bacteroidales bacterium]|nr:hypothetical protein [Bacteroidales bacterium]